jgi:hypothetical protein
MAIKLYFNVWVYGNWIVTPELMGVKLLIPEIVGVELQHLRLWELNYKIWAYGSWIVTSDFVRV